MRAGYWYASKHGDWEEAPEFASREAAIASAPRALKLKPGAQFQVACASEPASPLGADLVVDALEVHAQHDAPGNSEGYAISDEAVAELEALLEGWAAKHGVKPRWVDMEDVTVHMAPGVGGLAGSPRRRSR